MASASRAPNLPAARQRAAVPGRSSAGPGREAGSARKTDTKLRRSADISLTKPRPDLAARLRAAERVVRGRVGRRDALVDMVRAVNGTLDPAEIAELLIERAATWVPAPGWAVVGADLSGESSLLADRALPPGMEPAVHGIARWVMRRGEEFMTGDLRRDSRVAATTSATVVALPLSSRGRRVGAVVGFDGLASVREPRLGPIVLRAIRVLLEPAAVALDNSLLLKRVEALSVTDDLTQLYNSRYLNLVLRRETKRASRSGRPLSLLFIDLDGFKAINDSHGHLYGSRALVEAAAVIRGSARETDVVARFGGDEFAVVLPDTGGEGAFAVGERIRERLAAHRFLTSEGLDRRLTASVGVATLPDAAASAEELVQAADAAMYFVKGRGKNGILAAAAPADK